MADTVADASQPWYRSLNATQWKTLFASNLGWMFDGLEMGIFPLVELRESIRWWHCERVDGNERTLLSI